MLTWEAINNIYNKYEGEKGPFRKLFNTRSAYMDALARRLENKNKHVALTLQDKFSVISEILTHFSKNKNKLSHELAIKIAKLCLPDDNEISLHLVIKLSDLDALNENIFYKIFSSENAGDIADEAFGVIQALNEKISTPQLKALLYGKFLNNNSIEIYLAQLQEQLNEWQKAIDWYQRGVNKKQTHAMLLLAKLYLVNRGKDNLIVIQKNELTAIHWYRQAMVIGGQETLGELVRLTDHQAEAAITLAKLYEEGENTFEKNISLAITYYKKAANQNYLPAIFYLANFYQTGNKTIQKDPDQSFKYFLQAANLGAEQAKIYLERIAEESSDEQRTHLQKFYSNRDDDYNLTFWKPPDHQIYIQPDKRDIHLQPEIKGP